MEHLLNQCVQGNSLKTFSVQFSHQIRLHEKAPEFHRILMECWRLECYKYQCGMRCILV